MVVMSIRGRHMTKLASVPIAKHLFISGMIQLLLWKVGYLYIPMMYGMSSGQSFIGWYFIRHLSTFDADVTPIPHSTPNINKYI